MSYSTLIQNVKLIQGLKQKGGKGSGDWGHKGRPGKKGGSGGGGGLKGLGLKPGASIEDRRAASKKKKEGGGGGGGDFKERSHADLEERYKAKDQCVVQPLQCQAVKGYTDLGYFDTNKKLRGGETTPEARAIDSWIDSAPRTDADMLVFRQGDPEVFGSLQPGDVFQDNGFISTTASSRVAGEISGDDTPGFGGSASLEIRVKKGSKGAYIDAVSENPSEREFLLPRGSKIKVISNDNNKIIAELVDG